MRLNSLILACTLVLAACGSNPTAPPPKAPAAPTGLAATSGAGKISLVWSASAGATSYHILRGDAAGAEAVLTPPAVSTSASYTDSGLADGKTYYYLVQAVNAAGKSANSPETSATTAVPAPTGLTATGGAAQVSLSWTAVAGATSYSVQRGSGTGGPYTEIATPSVMSYTDATVAGGTTYYYVVLAVTPQGKTGASLEASALTVPDAPTGLLVSSTDTSVTVQWTATHGATDYDVLRAAGATPATFSLVGNTTGTSIADTGLTLNTAYVYAVRSNDTSGKSANATINVTTAPAAPAGLTATASNHHVALAWTAPAGAVSAGYRILRSGSASGPFASIGTASGTSYTDTMLTNNTTYYYVVHSFGTSGESGDGTVVNGTPVIELCALDGASYSVSVFDGTAGGNTAPKRSFGWATGIAEATGIGIDGANIYIASKYTNTVNVY